HPNDQNIYKVTCKMILHSTMHKANLEFHLRQFLTDNLEFNINNIGQSSTSNTDLVNNNLFTQQDSDS
ncbi:1612_t:CDS:2, partial [Funneliformis mosseae]